MFKKLYEIKTDKLLHFIANAIIVWVVANVLMFFINPFISVGIGFAVSVMVALWKEYIYDKKQGHGVFNKEDLKFGILGTIAMTIAMICIIFAI